MATSARLKLRACATVVTLLLAFSTSPANAQDAGALRASIDAPSGRYVTYEFSRVPSSLSPEHACSLRHAICVHANRGVPRAHVFEILASFDRAWDIATGALDLPPPDADLETRAYDVYIVAPSHPAVNAGAHASTVLGARDVRSRFDRASAFTLIDESIPAGCTLDTIVARELLHAILFRVAPAIDDGSARGETTYLAQLMNPCASFDPVDASIFQSNPDRALVDTWSRSFDRGSALFFGWLDAKYGDNPGSILTTLWALAPTRTPLDSPRWNDEPDGFEVLRETFKNAIDTSSTIDDLWLDFAASRTFFGSADTNGTFPEATSLGDFARVPKDWEIAWPAHPRALAAARGVEPTGSAYVLVHRDGVANGARLRVELAWESYARMKWIAIKLDARGHEINRVKVLAMDRETEAQVTLDDLDTTSAILFAGTNTGDFSYPFDPDDTTWEPHGWTMTLASQ